MTIRIGRTLPPAAAPIPLKDILQALPSCFRNDTKGFCFEEEIKQEFGQHYCLLVSSGKAALVIILKALHKLYPERDEVLIPAFTCYSVPAAIKRAGLKIKLCDTGVGSLDFDKKQLKEIIESDKKENKILCVLVTHLFGCPADFAGIKDIVGDKLFLVEDAAQAMGEEIDNQKIGTLGDVGFFSLSRGKALSTMEGGVIVTNRKNIKGQLISMSKKLEIYHISDRLLLATRTIFTTFLQQPILFWIAKALPFLRLGVTIYDDTFPIRNISLFQRSLARNWLDRLKGHQEVRKRNINLWKENLPKNLSPICPSQNNNSLIRFPVLAQSVIARDNIFLNSEETGCGFMPTYPTPINEISEIADEFSGQYYPNAKQLTDCLLTLPVHEYVRKSDIVAFYEA